MYAIVHSSAMPPFIFIRHATSENNTASTFLGQKNSYPNIVESSYAPTEAHVKTRPLLSAVLDAQVAAGTIQMYVSPLIRTWQTAVLLCKKRLLKHTRTGLRLELRIGPHLKEAISFGNQLTLGMGNNPASLKASVKTFYLFVLHIGMKVERVSLYLGHRGTVDLLTKITVAKAKVVPHTTFAKTCAENQRKVACSLSSTLCTQFAHHQYTRDGDLQRFMDTCTGRLNTDAPVLVVAHSKLMRNYISTQISGENCGCLVTDGDGRGDVQYVRGYAKVSSTTSTRCTSSRRKRQTRSRHTRSTRRMTRTSHS